MKPVLKTLFAAGVFATTAFASSAQAADYDQVVQYSDWAFRFEGAAGYTHFKVEEDGDPDETADGGIANTAFSAAFQGPLLFVQLDGVMGFSHISSNGDDGSIRQFTGGAFVGWRDSDTGVLAANVAATGFRFGGDGLGGDSVNALRVGGHGEMFFDMFTIGAAGGVIMPLSGGGGADDLTYAKGLARFYANDNLKFEGHGGVIFADNNNGGDVVYGRFLAEWKPEDSRVSYLARWDGFFNDDGGIEISSHTVMAGIRIYFGEPSSTTVKEQDRVHFTDSCAFGAPGMLAFC